MVSTALFDALAALALLGIALLGRVTSASNHEDLRICPVLRMETPNGDQRLP